MPKAVAFQHCDLLNELNKMNFVSDKFAFLHRVVPQHCGYIHRIGVAVYDQYQIASRHLRTAPTATTR